MANFIKLEAQEKANELKMKAQAEADLDKQMTVMNAKTKLAEDYDRKEKALAMEQKMYVVLLSLTHRAFQDG